MRHKKDYSEKLQDPRWQKLRLKVFERANFTCEMCSSKDKQLAVHHSYYRKNTDPWEYDIDTLHCVCKDCHLSVQDASDELQELIARIPIKYLDKISSDLSNISRFKTYLWQDIYTNINDIEYKKAWFYKIIIKTLVDMMSVPAGIFDDFYPDDIERFCNYIGQKYNVDNCMNTDDEFERLNIVKRKGFFEQ